MRYANLFTLLTEQVERFTEREIFFVRQGDQWLGISWQTFYQEVMDFACALKTCAFTPGKAVCIQAGNTPLWPVSDLGTIAAAGLSTGIYPSASPQQCQYLLHHAEAEFVIVDSAERLEKILSIKPHLPQLKTILVADEALADEAHGVIGFQNFLQRGRANRQRFAEEIHHQALQASSAAITMLVYTSGTTGVPKGACLSHQYVLNSAASVVEALRLEESDTALSYLPFCHVAERIAGFYTRLYAGMTTYFIEDLRHLWAHMIDAKPTIFGSLPYFFEKIHARIMADLEAASETERQSFNDALTTGRAISRLQQSGAPIPAALQQQHERTAHHLSRKVEQYTGGKLRLMTSGGAPLPLEIGEFFDAAGIAILEAYGLTENVCVAFNRPQRRKFGTVGTAMPGCEIALAEDGEILVRSAMRFSGYHKEPLKSAAMFREGWLLTGDLGELDDDGFLKITGRKKELLVTSTGKNIAPLALENYLKEHPLISHAMIYGDGKSYLVALITLNQRELEEKARTRQLADANYAALTRNEEIVQLVQQHIERVNRRVSSTEAIRKFVILEHDLSLEADEITPTMKVKREVVTARYKNLLEKLYR